MFGLSRRKKEIKTTNKSKENMIGIHYPLIDPHYRLVYNISELPEGIIIKRIFSRKGINKWLVRYHTQITEHYAPTLDGAITKFFKSNDVIYQKYIQNMLTLEEAKHNEHVTAHLVLSKQEKSNGQTT